MKEETRGRPAFEWTEERKSKLEDLAKVPSGIVSVDDIGRILGCSRVRILEYCQRTYHCTFFEYRKRCGAELKSLIFLTQAQMAIKSKDRTMLIWLGKCLLGQSERIVQEHIDKTAETNSEKKASLVSEVKELLDTMRECVTSDAESAPQIQ